MQAVDAIGVIPPVNESHVEMDLAWAMYEAWLKIQTGEVDTALVYAFGKSSAGVLRRTLALQLEPYTMTPLWPDTVSLAGLQARAGIDAGLWDERAMAEVVNRSLTDAEKNEYAIRKGGSSVEELLARPMYADPLRKHDCAPVTDGAAALVLAAGDRAREVRDRPAWITGLSHYVDPMSMGTRDLTRSPSAARPRRDGRPRRRRGGRAARAVQPPGADPAHASSGSPTTSGSTRRAARSPATRCSPPAASGSARPRAGSGPARSARRSATRRPGPALQQNLVCTLAGRAGELMAKQPAAVIGVGQTHHRAKREDVSMAGLCREAIDRALEDAGLTLDEIDAIVVGKAPDLFEGVMMPELFLAESLGAAGKPLLRVHTAGLGRRLDGDRGGVAGAGRRPQDGADRGLREAVGVERDVGAVGADPVQHAGARRRRRLLRAPRALLHPPLRGAQPHRRDRGRQGPAERAQEPLRPPAEPRHHGGVGARLADAVGPDPLRRDLPVLRRRVRAGDRRRGRRGVVLPNPAWIHGTVMRSEATTAAERDQVNPQASRDAAAALWKQAGITDPRAEIDMAEIYVPFSWFEPMWLESLGFAAEGEGWQLTESGATAMDGDLPVNCSGGVLSSNPIGASGMLRFGEAALQVRGAAGEHQVDGARKALGHAYGGGSQFFAMWVVGADKPTS